MLNYREFIVEGRGKRKYIAVQYNKETQDKLRTWAKEQGFDLATNYNGDDQDEKSFDFHTTIFYSTTYHNMTNGLTTIKPKSTRATELVMLGKESDIPVLLVDKTNILPIRKHYEAEGMKDEWPEYKAHVSVSYSKNLPDISNVVLPDFDLVFDEIKIDDVKERE